MKIQTCRFSINNPLKSGEYIHGRYSQGRGVSFTGTSNENKARRPAADYHEGYRQYFRAFLLHAAESRGWDMRIPKKGRKKNPERLSWQQMKARCNNPKNKSYQNYGGRGISVCDRWLSFDNFIKDMGKRPPGLMLERKDNEGNYTPENCCWATRSRQQRNKRVNKNSTTGITGVNWYKRNHKYLSKIRLNGKTIYLGWYRDIEDARQARLEGERKYWGKGIGLTV